jgi:hypothetical protein
MYDKIILKYLQPKTKTDILFGSLTLYVHSLPPYGNAAPCQVNVQFKNVYILSCFYARWVKKSLAISYGWQWDIKDYNKLSGNK